MTDPIAAEAIGTQYVLATYRGRDYKLLLDVEEWPLDEIAVSVGTLDGKLVADHVGLAAAIRQLLGDQWPGFVIEHPRARDLMPASRAFAAAAGFTAEKHDLSFGPLPRLLAVLARHPEAAEATLADMGLDYRDRWRRDDAGRRRLTLRQIYVRLSYMPFDCPLAIAQNDGKRPLSGAELVLMDVFEAISRRRHPGRPMTIEQKAHREAKDNKIEEERAKYRERHSKDHRRTGAIETARANARLGMRSE